MELLDFLRIPAISRRWGAVWLASAACASLLSACLPYSPTIRPAPPLKTAAAFGSAEGGTKAQRAPVNGLRWWQAFNDPQLSTLIGQAVLANFRVRAAWARLQQARALAVQAGAPRWPELSLEASAGKQRRFIGGLGTFDSNVFSVSVPVSYEVDLFGRIGAEAAAAELRARASREDVEALAMTLTAEVAERWFDWIHARAERRLIEQQLDASQAFVELTALRYESGLAEALDVHQQQQQLAAVEARLTLVLANETVASNQLSALLAKPLDAVGVEAPEILPSVPPLGAVGVPADLIAQRPDIRAAQLRVAAADHEVGAAIANRFPSLQLTGSVGFSSATLGTLFDAVVFNFFGNLLQPIVDGGRRGAEVQRRKAVVQEQLAEYAQTVIEALVEADSAIAQERQQGLQIEKVKAQVEHGQAALQQAQRRYREGLSDFLPVLNALTTVQDAELQLLAARRRLLSNRVQLCRALGGVWTRSLSEPEPIEIHEEEG